MKENKKSLVQIVKRQVKKYNTLNIIIVHFVANHFLPKNHSSETKQYLTLTKLVKKKFGL